MEALNKMQTLNPSHAHTAAVKCHLFNLQIFQIVHALSEKRQKDHKTAPEFHKGLLEVLYIVCDSILLKTTGQTYLIPVEKTLFDKLVVSMLLYSQVCIFATTHTGKYDLILTFIDILLLTLTEYSHIMALMPSSVSILRMLYSH